MKYALLLTLLLAFALRVNSLELTPFFGDIGWFYISARDLVISGEIPLVGITSSHTWLHQGPLWTYLLAFALFISKFHPLSGAYLAVLIGLVSVYAVYRLGKDYFSERIGILTAILFAFSPLVVIHSRMSYHTTPIPLFTTLFIYSLLAWIKGNRKAFYLSFLLLGILYNFELATQVLWALLLVFLVFGYLRREKYAKQINLRNVVIGFLIFLVPLIPVLVFDLSHGFPQTVKFFLWIPYSVVRSLTGNSSSIHTFQEVFGFLLEYQKRLIFLPNLFLSFLVLTFSLYHILKNIGNRNIFLVFLAIFIPLSSFIFNKTPSEAYLPILFPTVMLSLAIFFDRHLGKYAFFVVIFIAILNVSFLLQKNYLMNENGYGLSYEQRLEASREILMRAKASKYNIRGEGEGSEFESFTANYRYLLWWLGKEPERNSENIFIISETKKDIKVKKE